jgi:glycosyltransferase involved in cell wall biosynthesis
VNGWPAVSVVVATRDRPELLERALASILDLSYPGSIECIVVFDQSAVRPLAVPKRADGGPQRSIREIANGRTPGLAGARNAGILAADGELVAFCDDDDEWLQDKLTRQVEALRSAPDADAVTCGILVHYEGRERRRIAPAARMTLADFLRDRHTEVHPSTMLVRRETLLGRIGLVDESLPGSYAEDYEWLLRASRLAPILAVQEPLVRIHWHRSSYFEGRWRTIADALTYLLDQYPEFEDEPKGMARIQGQIAFAWAAEGSRSEARAWARQALRRNPLERRAYLALLITSRMLSADKVLRTAHLAGRGV